MAAMTWRGGILDGRKAPNGAAHHRRPALWWLMSPAPAQANGGADGTHQQRSHEAGITEAHFRFRRMHIHIHQMGIALNEKSNSGMAIPRHMIGIGPANGPHQQAVAHRAAIDEEELRG